MCGKLSENLEFWMTNLPVPLKDIPVINLAIPGTHDSMTYDMRALSPVAPDAEACVHVLHKFIPCVIKRWAVTQKLSLTEQLLNGIRYLDFRISFRLPDAKYYFVHGLYCEEIVEALHEIRDFLESHPGEVIILDIQHMYQFEEKNHSELMGMLQDVLGGKVWPRDGRLLKQWTPKVAWESGKQLLIIYRNHQAQFVQSFWTAEDWPTPWPNQTNVSKLKDYLEQSLSMRSPQQGFVTQCVLTPNISYTVPRFFSSLQRTCARKVFRKLLSWIATQKPGPWRPGDQPTVNVILADFVEIQNSEFCKIVVDLNLKLYTEKIITMESSA
ncbi:PI-PLC X domain-containing protein 3 [Phlebotomus papatasi]|uniref:Phosphatidylinositol-specific phospholipase C X domain-containing protein n=1 Tax=Phlebotomus papatasi TaxID=29031 RepID=A0A1B0DD55_PHLPP|nr:PI-PLC X domain-containing protein 3 [Phlebotomus papatasi]